MIRRCNSHRLGMLALLGLTLLVMPLGGLSSVAAPEPAGSAKDSREVQRLQREIRQGMADPAVDDETLIEKVRALAQHPSRDVLRFLVERVLSPIPRIDAVDRDALIPVVVAEFWRIADEHEGLRHDVADWLNQLMFEERLMLIDDNLAIIQLHMEHRPDRLTPAFYRRGLAAESWSIRVLLAHHLASTGTEPLDAEGVAELLANRWDLDYRVRAATVAVLERMLLDAPAGLDERKLIAYDALIDLLAREMSGLRYKITEILQGRTGQSYPDDAELWAEWVAAFRDGRVAENPDAPVQSEMNQSRYFGIRVPRKTVFVLDVSESMRRPLRSRTAIRRRIEQDGPRPYDWNEIHTRLDLAKTELIHVIDALQEPDPQALRRRPRRPRGTMSSRMPAGESVGDAMESFTIVAYSTRVRYWRETVVPATRENKDAAIRWIRRLITEDLTNIYDALDTALHMASATSFPDAAEDGGEMDAEQANNGGKAPRHAAKHPPTGFNDRLDPRGVVEAVVFLTDGYATTGKYGANGPHTFPALDTDGDGFISPTEWGARFDFEYIAEDSVQALFARLDRGTDDGTGRGDGRLSRDEFQAGLTAYYELQADAMRNEFTFRNYLDRVRIHCIGIGNHDGRFLRDLAEHNDGEYVNLGE